MLYLLNECFHSFGCRRRRGRGVIMVALLNDDWVFTATLGWGCRDN